MATNPFIPPVPSVATQFFPIFCKGKPPRRTFAGPPEIEAKWHKAMEEGRHLESSINSAMFAIQKEKADLQKHIIHYLDLIQTSTDAEFKHTPRKFKLAADIINYIAKIQHFMGLIQGLTAAIQNNLNQLAAIEISILNMIQTDLNAIAAFMRLICNLGLPALPSIPAYFGANIFTFNGFSFASFVPPKVSFSAFTNFSFSQCSIVPQNPGTLDTPPVVVVLDGITVGAVAGNVVPPLGGIIGNPTLISDPVYIAQLQGQSTTPIYNPSTINPATVLQGSLPDPAFIISNYRMPSATYKANVLSAIPAFDNLITAQPADAATEERTLLVEYVNLASIVASNYDKNLMAAWLYYLEAARVGRGGLWLPNFEAAYLQYIQPSLTILDSPDTTIPWNTVLGGPGTVDAPADIPLIDTILAASVATQQNILWKLSYIEASLLGYNRTTLFDNGADSKYVSTFTGTDTDYVITTVTLTDTVTIVLGADTAEFPVSCVVPKAILNVLNEVIAVAASNIAGTPSYVTDRPQFRFTYDAFAQATQVDRFSQFWRTFNYNLQQLLAQDPYVVGFMVSYEASLDSSIDPLGSSADAQQVENDALTRVRAWLPGQPLLPFPVPPVVTVGTMGGITGTTNGWSGSDFDPQAFLDRPDIQSLPLPVQYAMLRTNESYAALMVTQSEVQDTIAAAVTQANAALVSIQNNGFDAVSTGNLTVKNNTSPLPVSFDKTNYDNTNYVTSPTLFTVQVAGMYTVSGTVSWDKGPAGVRTLMLMQNSTVVLDEEQTDILSTGPITQNFSVMQQLNAGDTLQVLVTQATGIDTDLLPEAEFSVLLVPTSDAVAQPDFTDVDSPSGDNRTRSLVADATMAAGVAVAIQSDGGVLPVDPVGAINTPFVDGIVIDAVQKAELANVGTSYGSLYTITGATFVVGGLIYAGPGGVLTQDYNALITEVDWIVVIGRAIEPDMMLFQPQIPTKVIGF